MGKSNKFALIPVMFCFFAMGFVDLPAVDRQRGQHLPVARVLLVPDFQCANGYADEQDWP